MIYKAWKEPHWEPGDEHPPWLSWSISEQIDLTDTSITIDEVGIPLLKWLHYPSNKFKPKTTVYSAEQIHSYLFPANITFTHLDITPALHASCYELVSEQNHTLESTVAFWNRWSSHFRSQLTNYIRDTRPKSIITHDAGMVFILSDPTPTTAPA